VCHSATTSTTHAFNIREKLARPTSTLIYDESDTMHCGLHQPPHCGRELQDMKPRNYAKSASQHLLRESAFGVLRLGTHFGTIHHSNCRRVKSRYMPMHSNPSTSTCVRSRIYFER
jgi:hypothetical protein